MIRLKKQDKEIIIIDLIKEYENPNMNIRWGIITDLPESILLDLFNKDIEAFTPFLILSEAQGEAIFESHRNHDKFKWRYNNKEVCGLSDEVVSIFVRDLRSLNNIEILLNHIEYREILDQALSLLSKKQLGRVEHYYFDDMNEQEIADEEGVKKSSVHESITRAIQKMKKQYNE